MCTPNKGPGKDTAKNIGELHIMLKVMYHSKKRHQCVIKG